MIRLMRHVIAHLAVTGGMAASDSLIQQVLGHGVAAKLSARPTFPTSRLARTG